MKRFRTTNQQLYRRHPATETIAGVAAVAALGLTAAACSSSGSSGAVGRWPRDPSASILANRRATRDRFSARSGTRTSPASRRANPNITIKSVSYTGQCEVPAQFTRHAQGRYRDPTLFYAYFTDLHQVLDAGQAADITLPT